MTDKTQLEVFPALYVVGLNLSRLAFTIINVTPGQWRDSTNTFDRVVSSELQINSEVIGANGLDTGAIAASTWYAVYMIADSSGFKDSAGLFSTASSDPVMPSGYDIKRRIGWVLSTPTNERFVLFTQNGAAQNRTYKWSIPAEVLNDTSSETFVELDLTLGVPPVDGIFLYSTTSITPATAGNAMEIREFGSPATDNLEVVSGVVASEKQIVQARLFATLDSGAAKIEYKSTEATDALILYVNGFEDAL